MVNKQKNNKNDNKITKTQQSDDKIHKKIIKLIVKQKI